MIKIDKKLIGGSNRCFIIAEAGSNHDGKFEQAKKLVDIAAAAKADAIKFQMFRANKLYTPNCGKVDTPAGKIDLFDFFKQCELPSKWLVPLKKYSEKKGLVFIVTPFDEESADSLERIGIKAYKIGSPELNHLPLLKHIAKKQKPIFLADGLSTLSDIEEALKVINAEKNDQVALLHCVSGYPAPLEDYNLNVLETFKRAFGIPVGISDHTLSPVILPRLSVALGGSLIEKHFTLSRKLPGPDHPFAIEPKELELLVKEVRRIERMSAKEKERFIRGNPLHEKILGTSQKIIVSSEKVLYPGDKRSIFAVKSIKKGERISKNNVAVLRAERHLKPGMHPRYFEMILGKKVIRNVKRYSGLQWNDLLTS